MPNTDHRFDQDTLVRPLSDGLYEARIDPAWWIVAGPNGGYLAAILQRALEHAVADPERAPRSLTVHYTARPVEGPTRIETRVERQGRSLTSVTARMQQGDRLIALAVGAFSKPRNAPEFAHAAQPAVNAVEDSEPFAPESVMPFHENFEVRWATAERPWLKARLPQLCAWIRLRPPRMIDAPVAAMLSDALPPAVFTAEVDPAMFGGVPTIDLTIHFRATLPRPELKADDFVLARFRTHEAREGFIEEDGEIWSPSGELLVQSRQLAVFA